MRCHLALAALVAAFLAGAASAEPTTRVKVDDGDRLVAGGSVKQSTPVDGDLLGMAGDFELAAPVTGTAFVVGGNVRVREAVRADLFAAGGNVSVSAPIGQHLHVAGGNVNITSGGSVGGDLYAAGGDVEIRGPVQGTVRVGGGNVTIDAAIDGDVHVASGDLTLGPNTRIAGRLVHHGADVRRDPAATIAGGIVQERVETRRDRVGFKRSASGWWWTLGLVALAALIAAAFPAHVRKAATEIRMHPAMALVSGFIALICIPAASLILMITIIGLPVALVALLLYLVLLLVGYATAGVMIGDAALGRLRAADANHMGWRVGAAVAAMLALALLGKLPVLGGLVVFVALLAGIGAIVLAVGHRPAPTASAA